MSLCCLIPRRKNPSPLAGPSAFFKCWRPRSLAIPTPLPSSIFSALAPSINRKALALNTTLEAGDNAPRRQLKLLGIVCGAEDRIVPRRHLFPHRLIRAGDYLAKAHKGLEQI